MPHKYEQLLMPTETCSIRCWLAVRLRQ